jgi:hypothetical protein
MSNVDFHNRRSFINTKIPLGGRFFFEKSWGAKPPLYPPIG